MTTIVNDNHSSNNEMNSGDTEMWPTLNAATSPVPEPGQKAMKPIVWNENQNVGEPTDQEGWELLTDGDDDDDATEEKEARDSHETEQETPVVHVVNRKVLRHAESSPDFRRAFDLKAVMEAEDDDDASGSFAMVSGPGSVMSMSSTFSFRDAILSPGAVTSAEDEQGAGTALKIRPRPRVKPRFVVKKPMKRCAKSTGDLTSLVIQEEEEVIGASDAMEFYHRKALGVQTRKNGLKLRPDEAKRKQIILNKKSLQKSESRG
jgi:hypothetical protein